MAASLELPDEPAHAPLPTVIVVHGLTGNRIGRAYLLVELARRLISLGFAVLRFDQVGCGESTGDFKHTTPRTVAMDVVAARQWACEQSWCDAERIGFVAQSLGALGAIAADAEQPVRALALWAGVYDMPAVFNATARTGLRALLEHQGWAPYRGLPVGKGFVDELGAIAPPALLARSDAPMLVCHTLHDDVVSFDQAEAYRRRCEELGRPCTLQSFDAASHDFRDIPLKYDLLDVTVKFLSTHVP